MFINRHEREDVVKYKKIFLEEIKLFLPYFVEFSEDGSIQEKNYSDNCTVAGLDRRLIIMIIHDESTFLADEGCQKIWTLNGQGILRLKEKSKAPIFFCYSQG